MCYYDTITTVLLYLIVPMMIWRVVEHQYHLLFCNQTLQNGGQTKRYPLHDHAIASLVASGTHPSLFFPQEICRFYLCQKRRVFLTRETTKGAYHATMDVDRTHGPFSRVSNSKVTRELLKNMTLCTASRAAAPCPAKAKLPATCGRRVAIGCHYGR